MYYCKHDCENNKQDEFICCFSCEQKEICVCVCTNGIDEPKHCTDLDKERSDDNNS